MYVANSCFTKKNYDLNSPLAFCQGLFQQISEATSKYFVYSRFRYEFMVCYSFIFLYTKEKSDCTLLSSGLQSAMTKTTVIEQ